MKVSPGSHPASALFSGFVILAALTITTLGTYGGPCTPPPGGLVGWWPAEGNANDVIGGDNGSLQGGATFAAGKVGLGFRLDGTNGYVQIPDSDALKPANVTVEAWVWLDPDASATLNSEQIIFKRNSWTFLFEGYSLLKGSIDNGDHTYSNRFQFCITRNGNQIVINSTTAVQRGVWYHVAATYDGTTATLYVNGAAEASAYAGFALDYGTLPVYIGTTGEPAPYNNKLAGIIDEASIYNRALSTNEIAAIYNAGNAGKCTDLQSGVPVISSFTPESGFSGTMLIISGTSFSPTASANIVYFGAVQANVLAASPTNLMVMVPAGATYAPITVNVGGLTAYSATPFMPTFPGNGSGISTSSFSSPLNLPTLNGPSQTVIADIDGDGKPDIIVVDDYNNSLSIFRNISTNATLSAGSFAPRVDLPATGGTYSPFSISVADMDGDGKLDIIATEYGDNLVSVYRNNCTPGNIASNLFTRTDYSTGSGPEGVVARDLDGDGRPDIVVCNGGDGTISILQNTSSNGIVGFAPKVDFAAGGGCQHVAAGDLNGDGKPDLAAVNGDGTLSLFQNQIAGPGVMNTNSFAPAVSLAIPTGGVAVTIVDVDGDGKPDLATTAYLPQIFSVFQNIGTSGKLTIDSFGPRMDFPMDGRGHTIAVGDLDGDGKPDLVVDTELNSLINIFRNTSASNSLSLASQIELSTGWNAWGVSVGDLDGDGRPDVVFANSYDSTITIYHNQMPLAVNPPSTNPPAITAIVPNIAVPGAIVIISGTNFSPFAASNIVYFGAVQATVSSSSPTNLVVVVPTSATFAPITVTVGGLTAYSSQLFEPTFTGNGSNITSSSFASSFTLPGANGPQSMVIADLDGDGKPDISFVNGYSHLISIYQNISTNGTILGPGSFAPRLDLSPATNGVIGDSYRLRAVDLDGDGKLDLIVCDVNSDHISIFHNIAATGNLTTNSFEAPFTLSASYDTRFATTADLDGDGRVDIVGLNYGAKTISIYKNIGTTGTLNTNSFAPPIVLAAPGGPYEATIADLDGDGKLDLAVANTDNNTVSIYQSQVVAGTLDANSFAPRVDFPGGVNPETIAAVDLDGDGRLDLVVGSVQSDNVNVYRNLSSSGWLTTNSFAAEVDFDTPGWMHTISVADFNGDGKPDLGVVGELNSYMAIFQNTSTPGSFTVNSFAPRVDFGTGLNAWGIAAGDLDGDGRPDIVFGNYYDNTVEIYQNQTPFGASSTPHVPPTILSQTPNQVVLLGNSATFSVNVNGSGPLSYFWQRNGVLISGATNASYSLLNAQLSDSGSKFSCLVTNAYGSASSTNASLKVIDTIANDLCSGATIIISASYTNTQSTIKASSFGDPLPDCVDGFGHGVWYQFTAPVAGRLIVDTFGSDFDTGLAIYTGSSDALTEVACDDDTDGVTSQVIIPTAAGTTYFILVGGYGSDAGNLVLHLTHQTPPAFAVEPANQSVVISNTANFSALLTGALPMNFQWYFNGNPLVDDGRIIGSMTANLSISSLTTADAGGYSLSVTNFLGSADSSNAVLTVLVPPDITLQPIGRSVPPGLPTTFNAAASGIPIPTYQWQLNGTNIPGATSSSYTNPAVGTNDLGSYHLVASNSVSSVVSSDAQLTFGPVAAWGQNTFNESLPPPGLSDVFAIAGGFGVSFAVRTDGNISEWGGESATNIPSSATNVVAISTPGNTKYALRSDGTVVSWDGISAPAISNIVAIAAGYGTSGINFGFALRAEGTLTNWGSIPSPGFPAGLNHVTAIACGNNCALALRSDGTVAVSGTGAITNVPAGLNNVAAIAVGYMYAMALKANGTVITWGSGAGTNLPADMTNIVAISADNSLNENFGLAIRANGQIVGWGSNPYGGANPPDALTNWVSTAVAATALYHGLALVNDGSPVILHPPVGLTAYTGRDVILQGSAAGAAPLNYQWLLNGTNIIGATNTSLFIPDVQLGSAGNYQLFVSNNVNTALSLAAPLTVVSNSTLTFLSQPTSQTNYQGSKATLGVTVLGSGPLRYQWYYSTDNKIFTLVAGATNDSLTFDPAMVANSGYYHVAVSNQFNVATSSSAYQRVLFAKAWGYLAKDPPFDVTNAVAIAVGDAQQGSPFGHYLALKSDGKISSWSGGFSQYGETNVSALSNSFVTAVAAGYQDSLALKSDGTVYAWGYSQYGETNVPSGLNGVTAVACGDYHDLALKSDGTVAGWGQNTYQQTTNAAATNVVAIAAGGSDSMVLRADGTVVTWGGYFGNFLVPSNTTNIIAIAAGGQHYLALRANGTVVGWGNNSFGQTTIPAGISNVVAISAGANHSLLLRNDGSVVTLGVYAGQLTLGAPSDLANVTAIASSGDHDLALFGTRAPEFTVQPWNRSVPVNARTNITLAAKCVGVQPMHFQWQLNGTNVPGATGDTLILTNQPLAGGPPIQFIPTGAYQLIASNFYGIAASKYAKITTFYPLATALDTPTDGKGNSLYNWATSGNAQWFGETNVTHDGVDAAQSGGIGALQETILQTTVRTNWSGNYTFWWKVSSEQDFDILEFRVNGITQTSISGLVDWQSVSVHVAAFTNVLQWRYSKDASFDFGQDAGWVDQFAFIPDPPLITAQPVSQTVNMGTNVTMQVSAIGPPNSPASPGFPGVSTLRYQWRQNGNPVGGNSSSLNLNNVGRAQDGNYSVTVTNYSLPNNSIVSSNAVLKVLVPQLLGSPILLPNGTFRLTSTDVDGGLLEPSDLVNFEAQTSSNLLNWVTLRNALSLTNGMLLLQDSTPSNYPVRFYRLLEH